MSARIRGTLGPRHKAWDDNGGAAKSRIELPCRVPGLPLAKPSRFDTLNIQTGCEPV